MLDDADDGGGVTTWQPSADGARVGRSQLRIAGMWCVACAGEVERALRGQLGVVAAEVSYAAERATVLWDPQRTRLSAVLEAVRRAGYAAVGDAAAPAAALRRAEGRKTLWQLFVAAFCMMQVMMYQAPLYVAAPGTLDAELRTLLVWAAWLLSVPVVVFAAAPIFRDAWRRARERRIGMDLPASIGIVLTFAVSSAAAFAPGGWFGSDPYFDSLTMFVTFLLGGRYLAVKLRHRVAAALEGALTRLPATVRRLAEDGGSETIALDRLRRGDRVRVLAGEAFVADGPIVEGTTEVDEALLTGESSPVAKRAGDEAIAGSVNLTGSVEQRAERIGADTRYEAILGLMRTAITDRPRLVRAADRVAGPFLWGVLVLAAAAAAVWSWIDPSRAVWVAVSVLIVTCPCALSLAAPSALLAAAGALARRGVLVQRLDAIEALASADTICLDKTGTLTTPCSADALVQLQPAAKDMAVDEAAARSIAAGLARASSHPVAVALAAEPTADERTWVETRESPGRGVEGVDAAGCRWRLGAAAWVGAGSGDAGAADGPEVWLAGPRGVVARFVLAEKLRPQARASVDRLRAAGVAVRLLSGDSPARVRAVAHRLDVKTFDGGASPADKLAVVAALQRSGHRVAMVGDGLNDAPVLARADVSVAVGAAAASMHAGADVVVLSGSLADIAEALSIARRAMRVVRQNLAWAVAYNVTCVPLALAGALPPWAAGLGMAASSLLVVLNACRV